MGPKLDVFSRIFTAPGGKGTLKSEAAKEGSETNIKNKKIKNILFTLLQNNITPPYP
jgi:hypothetical protein